jgi:hypothetical protein
MGDVQMSITYCSHIDCRHPCLRNQKFAPKDMDISIADLDNNCYLSPKVDDAMTIRAIKRSQDATRNDLLAAICRGTQKTNYKCDDTCKALCGNDGTCAYCSIIADSIEEACLT